MKKIAWLDSCGMDSHIHATKDGVDTVCGRHGGYIAQRTLFRVASKRSGSSNFCRVCFQDTKKSIPWDERCLTERPKQYKNGFTSGDLEMDKNWGKAYKDKQKEAFAKKFSK